MTRSLSRLARNWDAFAAEDPLWSVLTWEEKRGNRWDVDDFFATGRAEIEGALELVRKRRPDLATGRALDFGCGVGRLTLALAEEFEEVHGVDIAAKMVEAARGFDPDGRVTYHVHRAPDLSLFADGHFDFVYSSITLQHMAPRWIRRYVREFLRVLAPGGVVAFQVPERPREARSGPLRRVVGRLGGRFLLRLRAAVSDAPTMDMFGVPRGEVEALLAAAGCEVLEIAESTLAGPGWLSWLYVAERWPPDVGTEDRAARDSSLNRR